MVISRCCRSAKSVDIAKKTIKKLLTGFEPVTSSLPIIRLCKISYILLLYLIAEIRRYAKAFRFLLVV